MCLYFIIPGSYPGQEFDEGGNRDTGLMQFLMSLPIVNVWAFLSSIFSSYILFIVSCEKN